MTDLRPVRLGLAGAGLVGKRHAQIIVDHSESVLAGIADPSSEAAAFAASIGVNCHDDLGAMLEAERPDGVIVATPNQLHVEHGLACVAAHIPTLIEKPIASNTGEASRLVDTAEAAGIPILVGHHRRHNPIIAWAKAQIDDGVLGRIVAVHGVCWLYKPDGYFDVAWRSQPGAGPVFINQIHDMDLMRHLCGEVVRIQAMVSTSERGHTVEDTAVVTLEFASGALGTVTVSDTIVSPHSWELTAAENPAYPVTDASCYTIGGTHGTMELPACRVWRNPQERGWWEPIGAATDAPAPRDPLVEQISHFARVIRGQEAPLVSGREGLRTLALIEAIKTAAETGAPVEIGEPG